MSRLSEALERAQDERDHAEPLGLKSARVIPHSVVELPSSWEFRPSQLRDDRSESDLSAPSSPKAPEESRPDERKVRPHRARSAVLDRPVVDDGLLSAGPSSLRASGRAEIDCQQSEKLVLGQDVDSLYVEQFRHLAAALHNAQTESGIRTVMVTSAVEGEGKTLTATNLALTLSHSYQKRVLLIDGDFRRPAIHELLGLDNETGLGNILKDTVTGDALPVHWISTLAVMTAGPPDPDPMGGLVSETMKRFISEASEQFDWIVVDTPPVTLLPDANLLAAMVDAAVLVVRAHTTGFPLVARAVDSIGRSRILGVVLNRADRTESVLTYGPANRYAAVESKKPRRRFRFGRRQG